MDAHNILHTADSLLDELIATRKHLHKYPELSFKEFKTQKYLKEKLISYGFDSVEEIADTGLAVVITAGKPDICIALRADMDALPIQEANQTDYASQNDGVMHACGHDTHMTALLGALQILNKNKSQWQGKVLAIFQPGEELLPGGATKVIESGIFETHKPRLIIGQHVMPGMPVGTSGFCPGPYMASTDEVYITVKGKGGHAATPKLTKDSVACASEILLKLKEELPAMAKDVPVIIGFGKFTANGSNNVIPSEVKLEGTFRTMDEQFRAYAKNQMQDIIKRIAQRYGVEAELNIVKGYPSLTNHTEYTTDAMEYMHDLLGSKHVEKMDIRMTGEDFAVYSQKMPSVFYRFGIRGETLGDVNVHNAHFDIDHNALKFASAGMAWLGMNFLKQFKG